MTLKHNDYLNYCLPDKWRAEDDSDSLLLYDPNGNGAITVSFFNVLSTKESMDEQISILAKKFIDKNRIKLSGPLIVFDKNGKTVLSGTGTMIDNWFIKIWIVAKYPKIAFATYQSSRKSSEVKECDSIVDSFCFSC